MKIISLQDLNIHGACKQDVDMYTKMTGKNEWEITKDFVLDHYDYKWAWVGKNLLSGSNKDKFLIEKEKLIDKYKQDVKRIKVRAEKQIFRDNLLKDIAVLLYKIYNGVEK